MFQILIFRNYSVFHFLVVCLLLDLRWAVVVQPALSNDRKTWISGHECLSIALSIHSSGSLHFYSRPAMKIIDHRTNSQFMCSRSEWRNEHVNGRNGNKERNWEEEETHLTGTIAIRWTFHLTITTCSELWPENAAVRSRCCGVNGTEDSSKVKATTAAGRKIDIVSSCCSSVVWRREADRQTD